MRTKPILSAIACGAALSLSLASEARADKICVRISSGRVVRTVVGGNKTCARGTVELISFNLNSGTSPFGNGAAGDLTTASGAVSLDANKQYGNITIGASTIASAASGSIFRAKGACTISGQVNVAAVANGGQIPAVVDGKTVGPQVVQPTTDPFVNPAASGEIVISTGIDVSNPDPVTATGGSAGDAILDLATFTNLLHPTALAAGSGGAGALGGHGGNGGGSVAFYCKNGVTINSGGTVNASGTDGISGAGGGSGGLVVFATAGAFSNGGSVKANGGNGGASTIRSAGGGGGGGGVVNVVAGSATTGNIQVSGGAGGAAALAGAISATYRSGGGAGGNLGGPGGAGGGVLNGDSSATAGTTGSAGVSTQLLDTTGDVSGLL